MYFDYEENRYILDVPNECPKCGEELELDTGYENVFLRCTKCNYELDVTEEFKALEKVEEFDENEDLE